MSLNLADPTPLSLGSLHLHPSDEVDTNSEEITSHQNFQEQSLTSMSLQRAKNKASMITPKATETTINNISVNEIEDTSTLSYSSSVTPTNFLKNGDKFAFRSRSFKRLINKRQSFSRQTEEPEPFEEIDSPNLLLKGVKERLRDKILKSSSSYINLEDDPSPENKISSMFSVIEQMSPDFGNGPKTISLVSSDIPHRNQHVNFQSIEENSVEQGKMTESPRLSERRPRQQSVNAVNNEAISSHRGGQENHNEIPNNDLEAQQINPRPQDEPREVLPEIESKLYLKRCISTFLAGSAVSACLFLAIEQDQRIFIQGAFFVIYLYLLYRMVENKERCGLIDRESWRRKEDILDIADVFVKILFVMSIHLKVLNLLSFSRASFLIICSTGVIYYFKSEAPSKIRSMRLYVKLLYALQALLLTLKLHGDIDWNWIYIFSVSWLFFGFVGVYLVAYVAVLILSCLFLVIQVLFRRRARDTNAHIKIQTQGILWSSLYYGLGASTFLALLGFNQFDSLDGNVDLFKKAMIFSLGLNGFLFLYTSTAFKNLTKYIQYYSLTDDSLLGSDGEDNIEQTETETKMQVFKRNHYFVMLSSTYFKPLSNSLMEKNEERLKEIKTMISAFKKQKKRNSRGQENPISVEELKQNKESLDKKLNDVLTKGKLIPEKKCLPPSLKLGLKLDGFEYEMRQSQLSLSRTRSNSMGKKGHLSLDDCPDLKEWNLKKFEVCQEVQEDNNCYLCCSKPANALLMGCGHGGICYDCAIEIVHKNNQCMQCRQTIDEVCKIDPSCQVTPSGFIKTIEVCKISRGV